MYMICCIVGAAIIFIYVYKYHQIKEIFGFSVEEKQEYDYDDYCELDKYRD